MEVTVSVRKSRHLEGEGSHVAAQRRADNGAMIYRVTAFVRGRSLRVRGKRRQLEIRYVARLR